MGATVDKRSSRRVYWTLAGSAVVLIGAMVYVLYTGSRLGLRHGPLVGATMQIRLHLTTAHLWLEELLAGDSHERVAAVWHHLDEAEWYARALLEGGQGPEGTFFPLEDSKGRADVRQVQQKLAEFRLVTRQRLDVMETSKLGTVSPAIDRRYDVLFDEILQITDRVETDVLQQ